MGRSVDETWIEEAIERYQRIERLLADFDRALAKVDVTVRSPDGLVEVVVGGRRHHPGRHDQRLGPGPARRVSSPGPCRPR